MCICWCVTEIKNINQFITQNYMFRHILGYPHVHKRSLKHSEEDIY